MMKSISRRFLLALALASAAAAAPAQTLRIGLAYVFIAHDLAVVKHIAHRVAVMYLGRVVETAEKDALFAAPRHPYTQALLAAIPRPQPALRRERPVLGGDVPSPLEPPAGCHFHTRCPHAQPLCSREVPPLETTADGHAAACHFWRELAARGPAVQPIAFTPARQRLARLQAAFLAPDPQTTSSPESP